MLDCINNYVRFFIKRVRINLTCIVFLAKQRIFKIWSGKQKIYFVNFNLVVFFIFEIKIIFKKRNFSINHLKKVTSFFKFAIKFDKLQYFHLYCET
jgi:hypothetical protein